MEATLEMDSEGQAVCRATISDITERKRVEEALRASERRFRALTENSADGIALLDAKGAIRYASPTNAQALGYSVGELVGTNMFELMHPDDIQSVSLLLSALVEKPQNPLAIQFRFHHKDGSWCWLEATGNNLLAEPAVQAIVVNYREITERKRAEEEIRQRHAELASLNHASQVITSSLDIREVLSQIVNLAGSVASAAYTSVVLVEEDGSLGLSAENFQEGPSIEIRARPQGITRQIIASRQPLVFDAVADDGTHNSALLAAGVQSYAGLPLIVKEEVLGVLFLHSRAPGAFRGRLPVLTTFANQAAIAIENARLYEAAQRELAERMRAEEEIRRLLAKTHEQARQVQQIMDTVPEGVLLLDAKRHILLANPTARDYLSVLAGATVGDALTHLNGRPVEDLLQASPDGLQHELAIAGPPRRVFEAAAQPMQAGVEAGGWVLVLRDVTQEREVQQRVQQQERLAAVGQLAAGIAHDFNNLLTGIIGFAQLLQMGHKMPPSAQPDLGRIVEQGQQAAHLIRQILDFSRRSNIQRQPLDLVPFLKEAIKFLARTIPENIHITLEVAPGEYLVHADPVQLQQVLTNLAVNARDAMPEGGELRVRVSRLTLRPGDRPPFPGMTAGEWIVLSVLDTGVGIPPEVMPHLFEPFFTTKEPGIGTGLGLAQVYGIVKQHDGYIDVASQVGVGTTFLVYLHALEVPEVPVPTALVEPPRGQGQTILLVEDEPTVRQASEAMLERLGYQVLVAADGQQAQVLHTEHPGEIALVLSDLVMPKMGGLELYRLLRERDPAIRMVVVTGYPLGQEIATLLAQGILGWIQKPFLLNELAQVVHRALKG
jgi:two-component system cell cycle sensor histidine kinase/response regulator CckA